ncbi:MAG: DUF4435 domain-containing protein [Alistipes sp.]|nr:DUF4435 domain-containing protein [Alistipes sp.]
MAYDIRKTLRQLNPFGRIDRNPGLPEPLPDNSDKRVVHVYVEGYDDVAFWRGIFDHFDNPYLRFEISVPMRRDLPKGKKVLMSMIPRSGEDMLLCVDSDFDYLFDDATGQSRQVNGSEYMFHTYVYATENYLCYAPSLHNVCVKATKNDARIFDFVRFMARYSETVYPLFLWYVYSARRETENVFPLADFKSAVRLGYVDVASNGEATIEWLARNVARREQTLRRKHPAMSADVEAFGRELAAKGVIPQQTYLYMHGHTLMDNVVLIMLSSVCDQLRKMSLARIKDSSKEGTALKNEMSNYTNSQRSIRDVLLDNENYTECFLYKRLHRDIENYIRRTVEAMRRRGEIDGDEPEFSFSRRLKEFRDLRSLRRKSAK